MAATYPPYGVAAMGTLMTLSYVLVVSLPELTFGALFVGVVMAIYTCLCVMVSANSWAAYDRQVLLIRSQKLLAATDELTGSPNRRAFLDRLSPAIVEVAAGRGAAVCLVDLDGFKDVNDREGHLAGDGVLKEVATALAAAVRETDTVAPAGRDEFAVLARTAPGLSGEQLAERLRAAVAAVGRPGSHRERRCRHAVGPRRRRGRPPPCGRGHVPRQDVRRRPRGRVRRPARRQLLNSSGRAWRPAGALPAHYAPLPRRSDDYAGRKGDERRVSEFAADAADGRNRWTTRHTTW